MGIFRTNDPTQFDDVDGIIVNEVSPPPSVQGVPANISILVGQFQRGPRSVLKSVGSLGELHEIFGKSAYSGNKELVNKRFGRLKVIRAVAALAAKASVTLDDKDATDSLTLEALDPGAYGNSLQYRIAQGSSSVYAQYLVECVADVSDSLDGTFFILPDRDGTVAFWIDVDDSGTSEPAHGADRSVEITTIVTDDSAANVAAKVAAAIEADSAFTSADVEDTDNVRVVAAYAGDFAGESAGDSGFTVSNPIEGLDSGRDYTFRDNTSDSVLSDEVYKDVKIVGKNQTQLNEIFKSKIMKALVVSQAATAEPELVATLTSLTGGTEGTLADTDYENAIQQLEVELSGNVVWLDQYNTIRRGYLKTHVLNAPDKIAIVAGDSAEEDADTAIANAALNRDTEGRLIYAWNGLQSTINGVQTWTGPAAWLASIISNTGPHIDPAFVANAQWTLGASDVRHKVGRQKYIELKEAGVCGFELDPDVGIKVKSGITTQILNSSKVTILRRRMADYLTNSIALFLKNYQNAPNTQSNRNQVAAQITSWDNGQIRDGILPGDSEVQSGKARLIDPNSLNTDDSIGLGFFKLLYKRRIYSSMRYIVLQAEIGETIVVTESE